MLPPADAEGVAKEDTDDVKGDPAPDGDGAPAAALQLTHEEQQGVY